MKLNTVMLSPTQVFARNREYAMSLPWDDPKVTVDLSQQEIPPTSGGGQET